MARIHHVTDVSTGQTIDVPFTAQEEAAADADKAAGELAQAPIIAEQQRITAIRANTRRQALVTAIQSSDDAQLLTYINNNVTDLASAKVMLANLALLVAGVIRS